MKIKSNKIGDIINYIKNEISEIYDENEIANLIAIIFKEYLDLSKVDLILKINDNINESDIVTIFNTINLLKNNYPIQYIIGKTYFLDCIIKLNQHTLIPRPETEELTYNVINYCLAKNLLNSNIIDIGTGSACIAIAIKKKIKTANILGIDISKEVLLIARKNALLNNTAIEFKKIDITNDKEYDQLISFDIIVSNPPYVTEKEKSIIKEQVLKHEPHSALFVPDDQPLKYYKHIADFAKEHLNEKGKVFLEINSSFDVEICTLFKQYGFTKVLIKKDLYNKNRFAEIAY